MFEKILVPLDGSEAAEMVLPYVEEIAARLGSQTILISVVNPVNPDEANLRRIYLGQLVSPIQNHCRGFGAPGNCQVETQILVGKAADEILRQAEQVNAGIIAMTTRGSSSGGPWSMGSITTKILRAMNRPVLLVRDPASEINLSQKKLIKRMLVPLDGSEAGEAALAGAADLALAMGSEVILFQVVEPVRVVGGYDRVLSGSMPLSEEAVRADASSYLQEIERSLKEKHIKASSAVVMGSAAEQIIDYSEANQIDLIAISTHGQSGIGRWVFGSVTDKVLHAGSIPVLVVKSGATSNK